MFVLLKTAIRPEKACAVTGIRRFFRKKGLPVRVMFTNTRESRELQISSPILILRGQIHRILADDLFEAPLHAKIINLLIIVMIIFSVAVVIAESHNETFEGNRYFFYIAERFCVAFFTLEFIIRLWASGAAFDAKGGSALRGRLAYITSFHGAVDWISIAPFYLQIIFPGFDLLILRVLRLLRLLKISRYNTALEDLLIAVKSERHSFFATLYIIVIVTVLSSAMMYYAEGAAQAEKLSSISHAVYWSLITLTTVGYGDISPVTTLGKVISAFTAFLGVAIVAMFTGLVASSFSRQVARRREIFNQELEKAYHDGIMTKEEDAFLKELQKRFDLSDDEVRAMKTRVQNNQPMQGDWPSK